MSKQSTQTQPEILELAGGAIRVDKAFVAQFERGIVIAQDGFWRPYGPGDETANGEARVYFNTCGHCRRDVYHLDVALQHCPSCGSKIEHKTEPNATTHWAFSLKHTD